MTSKMQDIFLKMTRAITKILDTRTHDYKRLFYTEFPDKTKNQIHPINLKT